MTPDTSDISCCRRASAVMPAKRPPGAFLASAVSPAVATDAGAAFEANSSKKWGMVAWAPKTVAHLKGAAASTALLLPSLDLRWGKQGCRGMLQMEVHAATVLSTEPSRSA
jgi:hypothetical protein